MKTKINRGAFIKDLGLSSGALMAFYCMGGLTACSSETEPAPVTTPPASTTPPPATTKIDFTLDLTSNDYKKLKIEGEYVYRDKIIIANAKGGKYVALTKACPHAGTDVQYRLDKDDLWCPNHGSEFSTTGKVNKTPAANGLIVYSTELKGDALRIFE
jgi:cytochrome b6-f complex iron-sulfur subunit